MLQWIANAITWGCAIYGVQILVVMRWRDKAYVAQMLLLIDLAEAQRDRQSLYGINAD